MPERIYSRPERCFMPIHHWREALNHLTILWPE